MLPHHWVPAWHLGWEAAKQKSPLAGWWGLSALRHSFLSSSGCFQAFCFLQHGKKKVGLGFKILLSWNKLTCDSIEGLIWMQADNWVFRSWKIKEMSEEGKWLIAITQRTDWSDPGSISQGGREGFSWVMNMGAGNGIRGYDLLSCMYSTCPLVFSLIFRCTWGLQILTYTEFCNVNLLLTSRSWPRGASDLLSHWPPTSMTESEDCLPTTLPFRVIPPSLPHRGCC